MFSCSENEVDVAPREHKGLRQACKDPIGFRCNQGGRFSGTDTTKCENLGGFKHWICG